MSSHPHEQIFFELYENEADSVFRFVQFKVSDRDRAKDIVQESFLKMWETLLSGKKIENPRAFLFRIVNNKIIDQYRKSSEFSLDQLSESGFDAPDHAVSPIEERLDAEAALEHLRMLPPDYHEVVWLRTVEGWSVKDIALHREESENVISVRIHRGIKMWRKRVLGDGKKKSSETS